MQRIHGLLVSSLHALPGLPAFDGEPDVEFSLLDALPPAAPDAVTLDSDGPADGDHNSLRVLRDPDGRVTFRYGDGHALDVRIAPDGRTDIRARVASGETLDDLTAYLYGHVLSYVLRMRGTLALHAGCVLTPHGAVLLAGASGAGKSTTTAALAARGCAVLSDDLTALSFDETRRHKGAHDDGDDPSRAQRPTDLLSAVIAHPAFTYLRVWSESEHMLYGRSGVLAPMSPTWSKLRVPVEPSQCAGDSPVRAVAMLAPRVDAAAPRATRLPPATAVARLTTCTNANWLRDPDLQLAQLRSLADLVERVPVWWVEPCTDPAQLGALCDLLLRVAADP